MTASTKYGYIFFIAALFASIGCSDSSDVFKIHPTPAECSINENTSTFCIPIEITLDDLEQKINSKIKNVFMTNKVIDNNMLLTVRRNGRINLQGENNLLLTSIPLDITIQKGTKVNLATINFAVTIEVLSDIDVNSDWSLSSNSKVKRFVWKKEPVVKFLGIELNLKNKVQEGLLDKREDIASKVDASIQEKTNLVEPLSRIWHTLQKPHNIIKRTEESIYLFINPSSISYISHSIGKQTLTVNVRAEANLNMKSSYESNEDHRIKLPRLTNTRATCENIEISLLGNIKFTDLESTINKHITGMVVTYEGYELTLEHVTIIPSNQDLFLTLNIGGFVEGKLGAMLKIDVDQKTQTISIVPKNIGILEGDVELELASSIISGFIESYLLDYPGFNYGEYLDKLPQIITAGVERGKSGDKWHPKFEKLETKIDALQISQKSINFQLVATGSGTIVVDQINMKK